MENKMIIKVENSNGVCFIPCVESGVETMINVIKEAWEENVCKAFPFGCVPFEELPEDIQAEVKKDLKAYNETTVERTGDHWSICPSSCITQRDVTFCYFGRYFAKDIYTKEERKENFFESFGYYPNVEMF